jgi:hypothetical protein
MSRERSTLVGILIAGLALAGCGAGAPPRADGAAAASDSTSPALAMASPAEADAMAPPPEAELVRRAEAFERAGLAALPEGAGHDIAVGGCVTCHSASMIAQQHKDTAGWNKTVTQMVAWGAPVAPEQKPVLVAYLAEHFPARAQGTAAKPVP